MSISFAAALAGTVLAAVGTGLAIRLCLRKPRPDMVAWVIALAGLTVGLAAQAAGYRRGFVPTTFRVTQLGAALVAPLALAWGMAELAAKGLVARFAGRLCLAGLFVVAGVILATDVLSAQPFTQDWPAARDHFEFLPLGLLGLVAVVVVLTVVVALITTALRGRHDPAWREPLGRGRTGRPGRAGDPGAPGQAARERRVPGADPDRGGGGLAGRQPGGQDEPGPDPERGQPPRRSRGGPRPRLRRRRLAGSVP